MKFPVNGTTVLIADGSRVEIDHCPEYRAVWLDGGEFDEVKERGIPPLAAMRGEYRCYKKSRASSFLGDIYVFWDTACALSPI